MSQEYPAQKLYVQAVFSDLTLGRGGLPLGGVRARVVFGGDFPGGVFCYWPRERVPRAPFNGP